MVDGCGSGGPKRISPGTVHPVGPSPRLKREKTRGAGGGGVAHVREPGNAPLWCGESGGCGSTSTYPCTRIMASCVVKQGGREKHRSMERGRKGKGVHPLDGASTVSVAEAIRSSTRGLGVGDRRGKILTSAEHCAQFRREVLINNRAAKQHQQKASMREAIISFKGA